MAKVHTDAGYKFYINDNDHPPPHVHVYKGGAEASVDLRTFEISDNVKFKKQHFKAIRKIVKESQQYLLRRWEELNDSRKSR